jgi:hypothetical protein
MFLIKMEGNQKQKMSDTNKECDQKGCDYKNGFLYLSIQGEPALTLLVPPPSYQGLVVAILHQINIRFGLKNPDLI